MSVSIILTVIICGMCVTLSGCKEEQRQNRAREDDHDVQIRFLPPQVPTTIVAPEARRDYLLLNYWNNFDFRDTTLIANAEITEQAFANFMQLSEYTTKWEEAVCKMLKASEQDSLMFTYFRGLAEKYMYNPNSPMRNEELYIPVLEYIIRSESINDAEKIRPRYQLEMLRKNRVGDIATDFSFELFNGKRGKLSEINAEYTLLFFNDPDCHDCQRVKSYINNSQVITEMYRKGQSKKTRTLQILAVYPGMAVELWRKANYPEIMMNSYDPTFRVMIEELYDLKAFPSLYLLDKNKRVLMKDAHIEAIEMWLKMQTF